MTFSSVITLHQLLLLSKYAVFCAVHFVKPGIQLSLCYGILYMGYNRDLIIVAYYGIFSIDVINLSRSHL